MNILWAMCLVIQHFTKKTKWEPLAVSMLNVFIPTMLQKPSSKSKNRDHVKYLKKRLELWKEGRLDEIMSECKEIQKRLGLSKQSEAPSKQRSFTNMMLLGKVKEAVKLINADSDVTGVHEITNAVRTALQEKHPTGEEIDESVVEGGHRERVEVVTFEGIDQELVQKLAKTTFGSGGPSQVNADIWKSMICSKLYGKCSDELAEEIANMGKRLCTEKIPYDTLRTHLANRLVPLIKEDNGIRPVGIGETLRRIIGKCVSHVLKNDVQTACGTLQTCAGLESGIEAAVHAMKSTFQEDWCKVVMLVDADNAFNRLNRKVALANIEKLCPPLHTYLYNSYNTPSSLYLKDGTSILSQEGATQGDNLAMAKYALGTRPLLNSLAEETEGDEVMQVWFADDSTSGGSVEGVKKWWDHLKETGPKYGYYPKPSKTHIIVKDFADLEEVQRTFGGEGIKITTQGQRHIGAALGSDAFKEEFVKMKVDKWVKDVEELAIIAEDEPQSVFSAFNTAIVHRWTFIQRTVGGISEYFEPLEDVIRNKLIPALVGRQVSDDEREMLSLPYRFGGMGIQNPVETADHEYKTSVAVTKNLTQLIISQDMDVTKVNAVQTQETKIKLRAAKELRLKKQADELKERMNLSQKRYFEGAQEKGASSWLSSLPIKRLGYVLNKQEFVDAVCLRYGWEIKGIPKVCACGKQNNTDHSLICKLGGFVIMRHNKVRDVEASLMREVCKDVQVEPLLLPANEEELMPRTISGPGARLDVVARDVWSGGEKNFF